MKERDADVVVLGAGAAGLATALHARGRRVCVLAPDTAAASGAASELAQGGIAAAVDAGDSAELHLEDTLRAAQGETNLAAARHLCDEAPLAVHFLETLGVPFARDGTRWSLHREAGHSCARVLHAGGAATGAAVMAALRQATAGTTHVEVLAGTRATRLLRDGDSVCGVLAFDADGEPLVVRARAVVVATGGIGGLYARTTNPLGACGDGLAMALAAGARGRGLEFVQFHPTALDVHAEPLPLITEALRGADARLVDAYGKSILAGVPQGNLAPRDIVARRVDAVQRKGGRVWLDATRLRGGNIERRFPEIHACCLAHGIDPLREPIPVTPAAHYHMGGIAVDLDGRTTLPGLWAVGEVACNGAHGANRLASNSLLEALVYGRRVGQALARLPLRTLPPPGALRVTDAGLPPAPQAPAALRRMMWHSLGVIRDATGLNAGLGTVTALRGKTRANDYSARARLLLAEHMLRAALRRGESCGAHYRADAPPPTARRASQTTPIIARLSQAEIQNRSIDAIR